MARMSLSDVIGLYRARLRARTVLVQESFAVLGIAVGVALLFASQVASTSLTRSVAELTNQIFGNARQFQIDARGPGGFDERLLREVRGIAGVQAALPVFEQQVTVIGPRGRRPVDLLGADPRVALAGGSYLRRFSVAQLAGQRAIALPAPIAQAIGAGPLQTIKLQIGATVTITLLGATLSEADIGGLVDSPVALAPLAYAQHLSGLHGRITRIFVRPRPGQEREVRSQLTRIAAGAGVNVEPGNFDSTLFAVAAAPTSKSEELFSVISALVGFMFALNAMLITVPSRRKLIETLRLQGATRPMIVQILLFDAAVLGVLACGLGLVLGELLSVAVFHAAPGYLSFAFAIGNARVVTFQSFALAVAAGLLAATTGVLWPLRDVLARPKDGKTPSGRARGRWVAPQLAGGLVCIAVTSIILIARPQSADLGSLTLVIGMVFLLPFLFDGVVVVFKRAQNPFKTPSTLLAVTELQTPPTRIRSLAIAATAAIAVFGSVAIHGAQANLERGLEGSARAVDSGAQLWVTPGGEFDAFVVTPFKDLGSRALAGLRSAGEPGVYRGSFLNWGDRRIWVLAPPRNGGQPLAGQVPTGALALAATRLRAGGWAVLSRALAYEHGLRTGEAFTLPSPQPITLRVAALSTNLGWPAGSIILNSGTYARAWASNDPSAYEIQATPGIPAQTARRRLQRALGPNAGLTVETAVEREHHHYLVVAQGLSRLTQIRLLVLIAAILAVAGAIGSMIWQRRDLVAFMKCQGCTKGVLWRWLLCESALLLVAGCSIGALFGLYGQLLLSHALESVTGFPIVYHVGVLIALTSLGLVTVVTVAIVAVAGYLVVRVPPRTTSPAY
jgi:putative ABC transport system permease protein